jgi:hypothetical protein
MKSFHCSCVARHNLIGCCRLSLRIVAWPIPALLTRISITPNRPCALETISDRLVAGEVGLDRHEVGSLLTFLHRLRELVETLGGAVDTGALEPLAEQTQHHRSAGAAGRAGHDCHALLLAHRLLPSPQAATLR